MLWLTTYLGKLLLYSFYSYARIKLTFNPPLKASDKLFLFSNATLQQISKKLPRTKEELLDINGISK